jgi:hypothetical protein
MTKYLLILLVCWFLGGCASKKCLTEDCSTYKRGDWITVTGLLVSDGTNEIKKGNGGVCWQ